MLTVKFKTDNAAFNDTISGNADTLEVVRLLREVADEIQQGQTDGAIMDYNGNKVGTYKLTNR